MKVLVQPKESAGQPHFGKQAALVKALPCPAQAQFSLLGQTAACREKETEIATGGIVVKTASLHIVADDIMQKLTQGSLEREKMG